MTGTIANASSARTLNRAMNEGIRSAWRKAERAQSRRAGGSYLRDAHIARMLTETRGLEIKYGNAYYPVQDDEARRVMSYITRHIGFSEKGTKIIKNFLRYMSGTQRWKGRIRVSRVRWNVFKEHADEYYAKQGDGYEINQFAPWDDNFHHRFILVGDSFSTSTSYPDSVPHMEGKE